MIWNKVETIASSDENVKKYVFTTDSAVAESVLYKYPTYAQRTVICCSTMAGCPIGCRFCFPPDEQIAIEPDLSSIPVSKIKIGDTVYSPFGPNKVDKVFSRDYDGYLIDIETPNGIISVTEDHPMILEDGTIIQAGYLTLNHKLKY